MTKRDTFIEKDLFQNILLHIEGWNASIPQPAILKPRPMWAGKQVISMFLPAVNIKRQAAWYDKNEKEDLSPEDTQVSLSLKC